MRPNATGWGLILFFLIGGIAFTIAIPEIWIGQIWIAVALFLALLYFVMNRRADKVERLRTEGIPATATILSMEQTGMYVNEMPRVNFQLRVQPQNGEAFEIDKAATVPFIALGQLGVGKQIPVYLDPKNPEEVELDWGSVAAPFTFSLEDGRTISVDNAAARQEVLQILQANGYATDGASDLRQNPAVRQQVLDVLRRHGYPVDPVAPATAAAPASATAASAPAPAPPATPEGDPVESLEKLAEMREKGLVTQDEFEAQKKRILGEL